MSDQQEIVREFLVEAFETLDQLDSDLVALEADHSNLQTINRIFRAVHTIKGTCGFLGFSKLESITHVGENLLDGLRAGRLVVTADITTALLALIDASRRILTNVGNSGAEGDDDFSSLRAKLIQLNEAKESLNVNPPTTVELSEVVEPEPEPSLPEPTPASTSAVAAEENSEHAQSSTSDTDLEKLFAAAQAEYQTAHVESALTDSAEKSVEKPREKQVVEREEIPTQAAKLDAVTATPAPGVTSTPPKAANPGDEEGKSALADTSLRVDVGLLDQLMNLVGELVLARNQILQFTKSQSDGEFLSTSQRLNLITSELQEQVMRTRMQPISNVWSKFPRVVRDVAKSCGKQVRIEMVGKETELDKTIIEAIKDPLTHIVRNSIDHGIEKPEVRATNGKNPEGLLLLKAFHEGGSVIIEIIDDGGGLPLQKIKAKAVEKGLISPEKAAQMSDSEAHKLIFLPGFSTAEQVTNISGRGVGMDVVRSNIERIGGTIDLKSKLGEGTTLRIKIPLTLAIVPALIISSASERFAIPQVSLVELVRVEEKHLEEFVEEINGSKFYRLRGNLLPLVFINDQLKLEFAQKAEDQALNIVVIKSDERTFGLVVDTVHDTEEIVVKPLSKQLKHLSVFAGATIMGDGHVALILDVSGIARMAGLTGEASKEATSANNSENEKDLPPSDGVKETLLIIRAGESLRAAVPLSAVQRLEEFPQSSIEHAAGQEVVQYRGGILPLVDLPLLFTGNRAKHADEKPVVVFSSGGKNFGCVVDQIIDIVEDTIKLESASRKPGILGSAVIQKQVTDLLDVEYIISSFDGNRGA